MPFFLASDPAAALAAYPELCLFTTILYCCAHMLPFSALRCYIFRSSLRHSVGHIAAGAGLIALSEAAIQVFYGDIYSTRIGLPFHFAYMYYFYRQIRIPFVHQFALSMPLGSLMLTAQSLAFTLEYHFPLFPVPFLQSALLDLVTAGLLFPPIRYFSQAYIEPLITAEFPSSLWKAVLLLATSLMLLTLMANPFNEDHSFAALGLRTSTLVGSMACIALLFYSLRQVVKRRQLNAVISITREMHALEASHYARITDVASQTLTLQKELTGYAMHIRELLTEKKYDRVRAYVRSFLDNQQLLTSPRVCDNELVNAIVSYWQEPLAALQVRTDIRITLGEKNPVPPLHMTAILGNLLKNASEALSQVENPADRQLCLHMESIGRSLVLTMDNTFTGCLHQDAPLQYLSAKRGFAEHGIGLDSIRSSVRCCDGTLEIQTTEGHLFQVSILLPLPAPNGIMANAPHS